MTDQPKVSTEALLQAIDNCTTPDGKWSAGPAWVKNYARELTATQPAAPDAAADYLSGDFSDDVFAILEDAGLNERSDSGPSIAESFCGALDRLGSEWREAHFPADLQEKLNFRFAAQFSGATAKPPPSAAPAAAQWPTPPQGLITSPGIAVGVDNDGWEGWVFVLHTDGLNWTSAAKLTDATFRMLKTNIAERSRLAKPPPSAGKTND